MDNSNDLRQSSYKNYKNEKGIILAFLPIVIFSLIFISIDTYSDYVNYQDAYDYFNNLYSNRLIIFAAVVFIWRYAKTVISGYVLLLIVYLFNILIVISDITNVSRFINEYENNSETTFYRNLYYKNAVNIFFLVLWTVILGINFIKWYRVYKLSGTREFEEHDKNE